MFTITSKLIVNINPLPFSPFEALDAVNASKSMKIENNKHLHLHVSSLFKSLTI